MWCVFLSISMGHFWALFSHQVWKVTKTALSRMCCLEAAPPCTFIKANPWLFFLVGPRNVSWLCPIALLIGHNHPNLHPSTAWHPNVRVQANPSTTKPSDLKETEPIKAEVWALHPAQGCLLRPTVQKKIIWLYKLDSLFPYFSSSVFDQAKKL